MSYLELILKGIFRKGVPMYSRKMLVVVSLVLNTLYAPQAFATERDPSAPLSQYSAEGNILIFHVVPGDKTAKIFFVGKKMMEVDFKKDAKILSVFLNESDGETLQVSPRGDYYEVKGVPRLGQPYRLSIKAEVKGKPEEVKVNISPKKP